ncbi:MAG: cytochrome c-type biogenesis protein [Bacillota bacterium]
MKHKKKIINTSIILLFLINLAVVPIYSAEVTVIQKEIEQMLVCQDDCGMLVSACDNATAAYMRGIIIEQIAQGKTKNEILQHFVSIYGEQVLSAPKPQGFNLTAYVIPFLAVIIGTLFVYFAIEKWVFHNRLSNIDFLSGENVQTNNEQVFQKEYEDKLEQELKKYW